MNMAKGISYWSWVILAVWLASAARLEATGYTLNLVTQGSGTLSANPTNSIYPSGAVVAISAAPATGWYFGGWSGNASGTASPLNVSMTADLIITGTFLPFPSYSITLATNGAGTISLNPATSTYFSNSVVTATATPGTGWVFAGWSGDVTSPINPLPVTVDTNVNLTGLFAELPFFDTEPQGSTNAAGSAVTLTSHVTATGPLSYQWYFAGNIDPGATDSSLNFASAQTSNSGEYWLVASSLYGSVTSSPVSLLITNAAGSTNLISVCDEAGLRAAVAIGGWVTIGCNGTITLSAPIDITNNVILDGQNVSATISGGGLTRLFNVGSGGSLSITNVILADGAVILYTNSPTTNADGGAILNNGGTVSLTSCTLSNNSAQALFSNGQARGGAVYNLGGQAYLIHSTMVNNYLTSSVGEFGGFFSFNGSAASLGGALYNDGGKMIFIGDALFNNVATAKNYTAGASVMGGIGQGGAIFNTNGTMVLMDCVVSNNTCTAQSGNFNPSCYGGAIYQASGSLAITNSLIITNTAAGGGGGGTSHSYPPLSAYGGGMAAFGGNISLDHVIVSGNLAKSGGNGYHTYPASAYGGGIYNQAGVIAEFCTVDGNMAVVGGETFIQGAPGFGGGIFNAGNMVLDHSSVYENWTQGSYGGSTVAGNENGGDGVGGGIYNMGQIDVTNCTIVLNAAVGGNGVSSPQITNGTARGGGVYNTTGGVINASCVTLASNAVVVVANAQFNLKGSPGQAVGAQVCNDSKFADVGLLNCLLAYSGTNGNASGLIADLGYNISSDGSANFNSGSSFNNTDPLLGALADNGGPTLTMALLPNSPCIDFGDSNNAPTTDQRGYARPAGSGIDIGAFEFDAAPPGGGLYLNLIQGDNGPVFGFTAPAGKTYIWQTSTDFKTWTPWLTNGPYGYQTNLSESISPTNSGAHFFRIMAQ